MKTARGEFLLHGADGRFQRGVFAGNEAFSLHGGVFSARGIVERPGLSLRRLTWGDLRLRIALLLLGDSFLVFVNHRIDCAIIPGLGIAEHTGLNVMTDVPFSKIQNMTNSRILAPSIPSARVSGSRTRLPAPSPLRTVHGPFGPHGSSLYKGILRHPATLLLCDIAFTIHVYSRPT